MKLSQADKAVKEEDEDDGSESHSNRDSLHVDGTARRRRAAGLNRVASHRSLRADDPKRIRSVGSEPCRAAPMTSTASSIPEYTAACRLERGQAAWRAQDARDARRHAGLVVRCLSRRRLAAVDAL